MLRTEILVFLGSLLCSVLLTRYVRNFAAARGWVDSPGVDRHLHATPVPRLGGVGICLSFTFVVGITLLIPKLIGVPAPFSVRTLVAILGPALVVFLMGLYDDLRSLGPYWKFAAQSLAAVLLYLGGLGIHQMDLFAAGQVLKTAIGLPLTILWVLLITNAFNLIDGLDGLAAGAALFSTLVVFVVSLQMESRLVTVLTIALAGCVLGFLRYNFHPASIFLGDSGSQFIGFMLSALALAGSQKAPTMVAVAIPVVSFGLPILDVALAVVRRFLSGKPLFRGDDDHIHHKLLKRGWSQREAALVLYAVTAGFGLLSLSLLHHADAIALVLVVSGIGVLLGVQYLRYAEFREVQDIVHRAVQRRRIMINNLQLRRATESLYSCADLEMICRILRETLQPLGFGGFYFRNSSVDRVPDSLPASLRADPSGGLRCCWAHLETNEPAWELKLELMTSSGYKWGYLSLFRTRAEELLLVDLNLLTAGFRTVLSDALQRAMTPVQAAMKEHKPAEEHQAAKAASAATLR